MSTGAEPTMLEVHLLQFPVELWGRATEHSDALQREFALMSMGAEGDGDERPVPTRLLELVASLRSQYASATSTQEELLYSALDDGRAVLDDLVYRVPAQAAEASLQLDTMYDEADAYCREGQHLLTLTTPAELVAFRRWFLGEFVRQAQGQQPTPWPSHPAAG